MKTPHAKTGMILLIVGVIGMGGYYFASPYIEDIRQLGSSDARGTKNITIGMDNWVGYFPLCSSRMKSSLHDAGFRLKCEDDHADYAGRMQRLRTGGLDFAVATVDSYLVAGAAQRFPGTIVAVIDESKGGDAVVARKAIVGGIDDLKSAPDVKIAFTPSSPSEYLLKAISAHFDIPHLKDRNGRWRVESDGSNEAFKKLKDGEVDVAVLWEPDVSRALALSQEMTKLLGTEDTEKLIVDILLANRKLSQKDPELIQLVLSHYFRTLKYYRDHPEKLRKEVASATKLEDDSVVSMLEGVSWVTMNENAEKWFGVGSNNRFPYEGLIEAIEATLQILIDSGDFKDNPLPDKDPYRIIYSEPIEFLVENGTFGSFATAKVDVTKGSLERDFPPISADAWKNLRQIGTFKERPISFQSGTAHLNIEGKEQLDKAALNLRHYPHFRLLVKGHTGLRGDPKANQQLSEQRAKAVSRYFEVTYGVDEDRLLSVGKGSEEPLPKTPGESSRAYNYRLPRVEMYLLGEVY